MRGQPLGFLLHCILRELEERGSILGIPRALFYTPRPGVPYATSLFGQFLATPIGPAAGPHTQLAQNIVCAWLSGGRFIELKTVQIMDELDIPRPCIDMAPSGEGYNVEWSQELKLDQSADEYVKAWVLIHVLHRLLGFDTLPAPPEGPGTLFNMSVGYNLDGITSPPMVRFMDRLQDAGEEIARHRAELGTRFPGLPWDDIAIPARITNSVTLSTMHGCPPDEIGRIARYLLEERGLHTIVKLNPTLLGKEAVLSILHDHLGYREIDIPDAVFEHDLHYEQAVELIRSLQQVAAGRGLFFGVKLSNTLAMANHRGVLPGGEVYMSGTALYPITMNLFRRLVEEFEGDLNVSYSAGADAWNVATILTAGARPVTAASDLLKPGGYSRLRQWLENLEAAMHACGATSLDDPRFCCGPAGLAQAAEEALSEPRYKKGYHPCTPRGARDLPFDTCSPSFQGLPKVESRLELFDCIAAPCVEQCAVGQDVPEYAWLIARGETDRALQVILSRNPLPTVTGYVCTHLCQTRCTRHNYDQPVAIRALKRFAAEQGRAPLSPPDKVVDRRVAVVGSGPSGLAAAYFLALNGVGVTVFEEREMPGGMLAIAPHFRLPAAVVQADIDRILGLGVELRLNHRVTQTPEELLKAGFDAVYLACGFQRDAWLEIEGINGPGVYAALRFLEAVARGSKLEMSLAPGGGQGPGARVLVIGGGNTAMDAARTAQRLTGCPATVVYRRTRAEMPCEPEELRDLLDEGNQLVELATPVRVVREGERIVGLVCVRNELGEPDSDGRRRPVPMPGSEFQIEAEAIILAIGQQPDVAFLDRSQVSRRKDGAVEVDAETGRVGAGTGGLSCAAEAQGSCRATTRATTRVAPTVYAGGDLVRGPATIIQACADGRRAAEAICRQFGICPAFGPIRPAWPGEDLSDRARALSDEEIVRIKQARARLEAQQPIESLPVAQRTGFDLVEQTLAEGAARQEANRCLQCSSLCDKCVEVCPNRANQACRVEPVRWTLPLLACRDGQLNVVGEERFEIKQARQVLHIVDWCNECGNCATFCVHQGRPYADKPRLFLRETEFGQESDNAFYLTGQAIRRREGGQEYRLVVQDEELVFDDGRMQVRLSPSFGVRGMALKQGFEGAVSLKGAAEMAVVRRGVIDSLPFLLETGW